MPVGLKPLEENSLLAIDGVRLAAVDASIYKHTRNDLLLIELAEGTETAAVFTRNCFSAAPVDVARQHLQVATPRYLLINAGNANAGTGQQGVKDAKLCCAELAKKVSVSPEQILPFSTGVIGQHLPVNKMVSRMETLCEHLDSDHWFEAAQCIMTTDTVPKGISKSVVIAGKEVTITGIAKGAGMICPNMATMLSFIATDACIERSLLQLLLEEAVENSFHRITVDGDTSTNDACVIMATAASRIVIESEDTTALYAMKNALNEVCQFLAQAIIRDAEGVNKFITLDIQQGRDTEECLKLAYTIAHSPLVKTAFFASDPNWGRLLAAIGRSGLEQLDVNQVNLYLNDVIVIESGGVAAGYSEEAGQQVMNESEITVRVELGRGEESVSVWTSDLSHDYVTINAEYRT